MHASKHYLQALEKSDRKALRESAAAEAKAAGSNTTRKVPHPNYTRPSRHGKPYDLGS